MKDLNEVRVQLFPHFSLCMVYVGHTFLLVVCTGRLPAAPVQTSKRTDAYPCPVLATRLPLDRVEVLNHV